MLEWNVVRGAAYFESYEGDYRCLLQFRGASAGIVVTKARGKVNMEVVEESGLSKQAYDLVYRTRASYLRQSLTTPYGHEILFVGSGGIFEFSDPAKVRPAIHRELMTILRPFDPQAVRSPTRTSPIVAAKRLL